MNLQNFLIETLKERFRATAAVLAIAKRIEEIAEQKTLDKYKDHTFFRDGMEFELLGVMAKYYTYDTDLIIKDVHIFLNYICKSKLPKAKMDKIEEIKVKYKTSRCMGWNSYKIPIWFELDYSVDIKNVLDGEINLIIK